mgnify:FL=1
MDKKKNINVSEMMFGKIPPNSKDIEAAILGVMLLNPDSIKVVKEIIDVKDFYLEANQKVCNAIFEVHKNSNPDYLLVAQYLIGSGEIEEVGGAFALTKLTDKVTTDTNIKQ